MKTTTCFRLWLLAASLLALAATGCSKPTTGVAVLTDGGAADVAAPETTAQQVSPADKMRARFANAPKAPPPPLDTRTPQQLAQAACFGGRCKGSQVKPLLGAATNPIIPPSWTVPNWYIDPANSIGCASDSNSGTSATCTGGCSGSVCTSGIGPMLTFQAINVQRWGCLGNPVACPRLRQSTTIEFLSSQLNNSDPVYVRWGAENGSVDTVQGVLGSAQQVCSTTLSARTQKNRSTPQLLNVTFASCSSAAVGQLVVNSTHSSRAWIESSGAGGTWNMSQPLNPVTLPTTSAPAENDNWTATDSVTVYSPVAVNVVDTRPVFVDWNGAFTNTTNLYQLTIYDPSGAGNDPIHLSDHVSVFESASQRELQFDDPLNSDTVESMTNVYAPNGVLGGKGLGYNTVEWNGGVLGGIASECGIAGMALDGDIIVSTPGVCDASASSRLGLVYLAAGVMGLTGTFINVNAISYGSAVIWGPGGLNGFGVTRVQYPTGADGGATTFVNAGGLKINNQTLVCKATPSGGITTACDLSLTAPLLDTNAGSTAGCTFVAGGSSFCNFGP